MIPGFCIRTANSIAGSNFCIPIRKCVHLFTLFIRVNYVCKLCSFLHHPNTVKMLSSERTFPKKAGMRTISQMRSNVKKCPAAEPLCCRAFCCHRNLIFKSSTFSSIRQMVFRNASSLLPLGSSNPQSSRWEQGSQGH